MAARKWFTPEAIIGKLRVAGYYFDTMSHADDIVANTGLGVLSDLEHRKRHVALRRRSH